MAESSVWKSVLGISWAEAGRSLGLRWVPRLCWLVGGWSWVERVSLFFPYPPPRGMSCVTEGGGARMKQGSQEAAGGAGVCGVQSPQCEVQPHPLPELCIDEPTASWGCLGTYLGSRG